MSTVNTVPIEYGPRITEEYVSAAEEDKTLHEAIQQAIAFFDKNNVVLKLVQINPQTPEVTAQGLHANVIFYVDCIYLENDNDEQNLLNDITIIYNELTNCFLRSKNLNYHPWIVLVVHHPTEGWGQTVFAPGEYIPHFIYGNYTEDTLPYPYK